jgi:Domain of unknown function (DUF4118)
MRKGTDYILKLRPWSLSTFMAALLAVAFATTMQELFAEFGARICFAGFFPAILIASLLGGAPAGIFATLLTIPIVWWAFMPPYFEFSPFTPAAARPSRFCENERRLASPSGEAIMLPDETMIPQKLVVLLLSLAGGAVGLFAPVGAVKWLMQTEPRDAGILTLFFFPVWCCLVVVGLLIGRRVGRSAIGTRRIAPRQHPPPHQRVTHAARRANQ